MIINFDGRSYEIRRSQVDTLLNDFEAEGLKIYKQQPDELRFLAKPVIRWILMKFERGMARMTTKQEAAQVCRPPKGIDPMEHFGHLILSKFGDLLNGATLDIQTDGASTTAFNLQLPAPREAGGPVVVDGDIRRGQDDGAEISG